MFIQQLETAMYREETRNNLIDQFNIKAKEYYQGHWSQKGNGNIGIRISSIICSH